VKEILIEIGTEEIPSGFLVDLMGHIGEDLGKVLGENLIVFGEVKTFLTPRRIALIVRNVGEKQRVEKLVIQGPPVRIAYNNGKPTKALESFLKKNSAELQDIKSVETPRGEYVAIEKVVGGRDVKEVLPGALKRFISSIKFPKSMRWNSTGVTFARPIRWIVALWGDEVLDLEYAGVRSGRLSRGHRFLGKDVEISSPEDYEKLLEREKVIVDVERRKSIILDELNKLASEVNGRINLSEKLLNEVTFLVEYPRVVRGRIEEKYLDLPPEVIITTAEHHQKYFTASDSNGKLLPYFFTVSNMPIEDMSEIVKGNERVLRSRLEDAEFFFREDLKTPLIDLLEKLKGVTYQRKLGSLYDKVMRIKDLSEAITEKLNWIGEREKIIRTALLSKCDLLTDMVYEFPELQGVMGKEYALRQGEDEDVAWGIYEHYLPRFAGDELPSRKTGIVVALADKIDTVVSGFVGGLKVTGGQDPFGLRRAAIGVITILIEKEIFLNLSELIEIPFERLMELAGKDKKVRGKEPEKIKEEIIDFFLVRFENILAERGIRKDIIRAVSSVEFSDPYLVFLKIKAINEFVEREDFRDLSIAYKRVLNILKGQTPAVNDFSEELLVEESERKLWEEFKKFQKSFSQSMEQLNFKKAMEEILLLKPFIDKFFDDVLVMSEDEKIRNNRLSLLYFISREFRKMADFSQIIS